MYNEAGVDRPPGNPAREGWGQRLQGHGPGQTKQEREADAAKMGGPRGRRMERVVQQVLRGKGAARRDTTKEKEDTKRTDKRQLYNDVR